MDPTEPQTQDDAASDLHEIQHLAGNSFALLRAIVRWSAETATSVDSYAWHLEGRIDVIGRIMLGVMRDPSARFDLARLIEDELNEQHASDGANAWSLDGPPVAMGSAAAEVLGLVFYELVINSIEHGALGMDDGGELHVRWRIQPAADDADGEEALILDWVERGAPARLSREGFGSVVLDGMLRYQLDASAERAFGPEGVRISLKVPTRNLLPRAGEGLPDRS